MEISEVKKSIAERLDEDVVEITQGVGSQPSFIVKTADHSYFVKTTEIKNDSLMKESQGLVELSKVYANVPKVHHCDSEFLIIDYIEPQTPTQTYWEQLGTHLANMHKQQQDSFGFRYDNWIGLSEQKNKTSTEASRDPGVFFWENRIKFKLQQAEEKRTSLIGSDQSKKLKEKVITQLNHKEVYSSPLHGDLWGGNIVCGRGSQAYLIDPAFYYGDRESDIAMTECFGGFSSTFYDTYNSILPLSEGYEERKHIFNLYHMLNHYIIFGDNYKSTSLKIIESILSS